ncbi:hypothetical protein BDV96DRAFT_589928 [Lophiotrema nucula]|uniref:Uncharacterized protein n=1 Tax=Lophiotrema nucula TaxID=690887 RepID=A0A6A5YLX8_9PLEO|nr:hypothetical protein BDV96DRAFT_589928 [Lophiotrema nucula]
MKEGSQEGRMSQVEVVGRLVWKGASEGTEFGLRRPREVPVSTRFVWSRLARSRSRSCSLVSEGEGTVSARNFIAIIPINNPTNRLCRTPNFFFSSPLSFDSKPSSKSAIRSLPTPSLACTISCALYSPKPHLSSPQTYTNSATLKNTLAHFTTFVSKMGKPLSSRSAKLPRRKWSNSCNSSECHGRLPSHGPCSCRMLL